jgi:hypothetical protein
MDRIAAMLTPIQWDLDKIMLAYKITLATRGLEEHLHLRITLIFAKIIRICWPFVTFRTEYLIGRHVPTHGLMDSQTNKPGLGWVTYGSSRLIPMW